VRTRNVQTTVSAHDGQTVIIGGLINKTHGTVRRRVPVIGDMPVIGNLFRFDSETEGKAELLIILTPHVIEDEEDIERIKQMEAARINWCMADVLELHGDGGFRGRNDEWYDAETHVVYPDLNPTGEQVPAPQPAPGMPGAQPTPALPLPQMPDSSLPEPGLSPPLGSPTPPGTMPPSELRLREPPVPPVQPPSPVQPSPHTPPLPELPGQSQYRPPVRYQQAWSPVPSRSHPIPPVVLPAPGTSPSWPAGGETQSVARTAPGAAEEAPPPPYGSQPVRPVAYWEQSNPAPPYYER
jgi:hypothetical protein